MSISLTTMATTDIDAAGDVVVQIGEERVRISSKVMSLASPVFQAMFTSGFKEGMTHQATASNPISMPDDDPTAFIYLSRAIHFQGSELPEHVDIAFFEKLAGLYDKYQCAASIASYVQAPLEKLTGSASTRNLDKILFLFLDMLTAKNDHDIWFRRLSRLCYKRTEIKY
ncbi:hypothetical protein PV04_06710 [Phialophora macrospora]|uniref:BTB domain-containing protein n=1 Tax=Phialophora macrospora TaxID=1851006 RepID=A0A0D2CQQ5_9EURO|nr:hypothetical protein PV04_06710 [Phialophora macrospora]